MERRKEGKGGRGEKRGGKESGVKGREASKQASFNCTSIKKKKKEF